MKRIGRITAVLLAVLMTLEAALFLGAVPSFAEEDDNEHVYSYEEEYTAQHIAFLDNDDYRLFELYDGGFADMLSEAYEDAGLSVANGSWDFLDKTASLVGDGELKITNAYELLVSGIMMSTASGSSFTTSYEDAYVSSLLDWIDLAVSIFSDTESFIKVAADADLDKIDDLVDALDTVRIAVLAVKGADSETLTPVLGNAIDEIKDSYKNAFMTADDQAAFKKLFPGLKVAGALVEGAQATFSEMIDNYLFYNTCANQPNEWFETWENIAEAGALSTDSEDKKLSKAISSLINQLKKAQNDMAGAIMDEAKADGVKELVKAGIKAGHDIYLGLENACPILKGIAEGASSGIELANALFNSNDTASNGKMLVGTGHLSKLVWEEVQEAAENLSENLDYESALLFDAAFHVFKEIQLTGCDYAIGYLNSIASAGIEQIPGPAHNWSTMDEIAAIVQLQGKKADLSRLQCHEFHYIPENNGGSFVGYRGDVYYWMYGDDSLFREEAYGRFGYDETVKNNLVVRHPDASQEIIYTGYGHGDGFYGGLYISGEHIFFNNPSIGNGNIDVLKLDGTYVTSHEGFLEGVDASRNILVARSYGDNGAYFRSIKEDGSSLTLTSENYGNRFLFLRDGKLYYFVCNNGGTSQFMSVELESGFSKVLAEVETSEEGLGVGWLLGNVVQGENCFYVWLGTEGGTGAFQYDGTIYEVGYDIGKRAVGPEEGYPCNASVIYIKNQKNSRESELSYYCGPWNATMRGFWDCMLIEEDVAKKRIDFDGFEITSGPLAIEGKPFPYQGGVYAYLDDSGIPIPILTEDEAAALGVSPIDWRESGQFSIMKTLDVIGPYVYFTMATMHQSQEMFGRPYCERDQMTVYVKHLTTGAITKLYSYGEPFKANISEDTEETDSEAGIGEESTENQVLVGAGATVAEKVSEVLGEKGESAGFTTEVTTAVETDIYNVVSGGYVDALRVNTTYTDEAGNQQLVNVTITEGIDHQRVAAFNIAFPEAEQLISPSEVYEMLLSDDVIPEIEEIVEKCLQEGEHLYTDNGLIFASMSGNTLLNAVIDEEGNFLGNSVTIAFYPGEVKEQDDWLYYVKDGAACAFRNLYSTDKIPQNLGGYPVETVYLGAKAGSGPWLIPKGVKAVFGNVMSIGAVLPETVEIIGKELLLDMSICLSFSKNLTVYDTSLGAIYQKIAENDDTFFIWQHYYGYDSPSVENVYSEFDDTRIYHIDEVEEQAAECGEEILGYFNEIKNGDYTHITEFLEAGALPH